LDLEELQKRTEGTLHDADSARRYWLGVFVILGLLGTLFGLAEALSELAGQVGGVRTARSFEPLLSGLKSAFAPSIWGVTLTVMALAAAVAGSSGALERWATAQDTAVRVHDRLLNLQEQQREALDVIKTEVSGLATPVRQALENLVRETETARARNSELVQTL